MTHSEVATAFAKREKPKGNGSRMWFKGRTIYSYGAHFPIAILTKHKGAECVLFTTRSYSSSTSAHKNLVQWALKEHCDLPVFAGPLEPDDVYGDGVSRELAVRFADSYTSRITALAASHDRATKCMDAYRKRIEDVVAEANRFQAFLGKAQKFKMPTLKGRSVA
jgi:hypothetical protein